MQYKTGHKTVSVLDTPKQEGDNRPNYQKLYTLHANGRTYYLSIYLTIGSSKDAGNGIQVFSIEHNKLNDHVKLIKTQTGLHSQLNYDYDFRSVVNINFNARPTITFDPSNKTIHIPLVNNKKQVTSKYIVYKFTGQYFEK